MAKCYHCGQVLSDEWLRKVGAALLGQKGGQNKKRKTSGKIAAQARWQKKKVENPSDK